MEKYKFILVDQPEKFINRITLNRPEKRNALNNHIRGEVFDALEKADDDEKLRVSIIRGAGTCFSAGYDLGSDLRKDRPWFTSPEIGLRSYSWPRHLTEGWFKMWDMAKPIIAQVHGYCLAGASELATACDLVYVADDAQIGYPAVRSISPPDLQYPAYLMGLRAAMEFMLTGSSLSGKEAARVGFANRSFPADKLEEKVLEMARSVANIPPDLQILNKRSVHQAMEIMGIRNALRAGHSLVSLAHYTKSTEDFIKQLYSGESLTKAFSKRDGKWGDYRTKE
ncbi:MAG: enoyl-CoA hydratase-related protein [Candidatus Hodarchaeales archaeon]|jgi:enoyl-CoA hydratase